MRSTCFLFSLIETNYFMVIVSHKTVRYGTAWHNMVWYGSVRMVWHAVVCFVVLYYSLLHQ